MQVPFFRPSIAADEIDAVVQCLRSGWLTTGQVTKTFEAKFAERFGIPHAVALNSCTAALHLALEAIGLQRGELVIVPTMTFAATAEVVRYFDAIPVFVDAEPRTLLMDLEKLSDLLDSLHGGGPVPGLKPPYPRVRAVIPMHYGGQMVAMDVVRRLAERHQIHVIEDCAHSLPAAHRAGATAPWQGPGENSDVACFSFYANKCITTGEGGMAITRNEEWAERMRVMSLHGMSKDAWKRFTGSGSWYYEIIAPGFKYNLTDIASALGVGQLERLDELWVERRRVAACYQRELGDLDFLELPLELANRRHSWHLFQIELRLEHLAVDRARFIDELKARGVACSVHWMPLHMHPYYTRTYAYPRESFPVASASWERLISLPIFPYITEAEQAHVIATVKAIGEEHRKR